MQRLNRRKILAASVAPFALHLENACATLPFPPPADLEMQIKWNGKYLCKGTLSAIFYMSEDVENSLDSSKEVLNLERTDRISIEDVPPRRRSASLGYLEIRNVEFISHLAQTEPPPVTRTVYRLVSNLNIPRVLEPYIWALGRDKLYVFGERMHRVGSRPIAGTAPLFSVQGLGAYDHAPASIAELETAAEQARNFGFVNSK